MNTFVHGVSNHTDSYVVPVSGLPYNASLKLENVGTFDVVRPRLLVNARPDWATIDAILQDAIKPGMSDREKALALWQFGRANRYHWWPPTEVTFDDSDPVKLFSVYGYGFCTNIAQVLCALWERAGLPSRFWTIGPNGQHQASEAFFEGGWHLLDADCDALYLRWDNTTIAGVADLIDDPALVSRAGPNHYCAAIVSYYAGTPKDAWLPGGVDVYSTGHEIGMTLRPHESLTLEWGGGRGYHDDSGAGGAAPPIYGNGQILSSVDLTDPGYGWSLFSQNGLRTGTIDGQLPRLGPAGLQAPGEFMFRVDSPYPIIGARLDADVRRAASDDSIDIRAVGWGDGINLINESLSGPAKEYRLPGVFVSESNISTLADDGAWPPIHTKWGMQPANVVYHVTPTLEAGARVIVGGAFYRYLDGDFVGLSISADGMNFRPVWTAGPKQLGYFSHREDVTDAVLGLSSFFVRYDLNALSRGGPYSNWTAGISSIAMSGVSPSQDSLAFTTTGTPDLGDYPVSVDLTSVVARPTAAAAYHYLIRVSMRSSTSVHNVGINTFNLTTTVQVAPDSLPALGPGNNIVTYGDGSGDPVALQVTHSWNTYPGAAGKPTAPSPPIVPADGSDVSISAPIQLSWGSSTTPNGGPGTQDPGGSRIFQYHMRLCDRSDCAWPLSPIFDVYTSSATPGFPLSFTDWLAPGRRYYWQVQAEDTYALWGDWSPVWSFVPWVPQVLTVSKAGSGAGGVSSTPAGIQCGAACSASFAAPAVVLTAAPEAGSFFVGWSGSGCLGTGTCTISMAAAQTVTATFDLVSAPSVTTGAASGITQTAATLNGTVNPNGASTTTAFEYGPTTAYGSTVAALTLTGSTAQAISAGVTPLACGTVYHFRARGTNSGGTGTGLDATFTTATCSSPVATTGVATGITQTTATLNGTVNPNGASTTTAFEYGPTTAYGSTVAALTLTGSTAQAISAGVTPLACGTVYHFRARGTNSGGTGTGLDATFTTATCSSPVATTGVATGITQTTATLNGTVNPNGASTTTAFEYGPTTAYGSTVSALTLTGSTAQAISAGVTGLSCETVYHFRAKGTNSGGTGIGADATFTASTCPSAGAPTVTFPTNGSTLTISTQALWWTAVAKADPSLTLSYEVLLTDIAGGNKAELQITVPDSELSTIYSLHSSSQYELKVRACQAGCGPWSPPVTFAVRLPAVPTEAPGITECTVSEGNILTCNWSAVARADLFRIYVVQPPPAGPGGGALSVAARVVSATTATLPVPTGVANVIVAACNGDGCGPFSPSVGINPTGPNPMMASLGTPLGGSVVSGPTVMFSWNRVPGDNGSNTVYRLFVQDLSRQSTALDVYTTQNFWAAYFKAEGTRYDALVIANPGPGQVVGPAQGFSVSGASTTAPTLVAPAHNSTVSAGNIPLGWSPVPGATLYEYYVAVQGQGSTAAHGVTPGLMVQVPLTGAGGGTLYSGIVRACPVGATCVFGSDTGWGPWSNAPGGPGVTNFTVTP